MAISTSLRTDSGTRTISPEETATAERTPVAVVPNSTINERARISLKLSGTNWSIAITNVNFPDALSALIRDITRQINLPSNRWIIDSYKAGSLIVEIDVMLSPLDHISATEIASLLLVISYPDTQAEYYALTEVNQTIYALQTFVVGVSYNGAASMAEACGKSCYAGIGAGCATAVGIGLTVWYCYRRRCSQCSSKLEGDSSRAVDRVTPGEDPSRFPNQRKIAAASNGLFPPMSSPDDDRVLTKFMDTYDDGDDSDAVEVVAGRLSPFDDEVHVERYLDDEEGHIAEEMFVDASSNSSDEDYLWVEDRATPVEAVHDEYCVSHSEEQGVCAFASFGVEVDAPPIRIPPLPIARAWRSPFAKQNLRANNEYQWAVMSDGEIPTSLPPTSLGTLSARSWAPSGAATLRVEYLTPPQLSARNPIPATFPRRATPSQDSIREEGEDQEQEAFDGIDTRAPAETSFVLDVSSDQPTPSHEGDSPRVFVLPMTHTAADDAATDEWEWEYFEDPPDTPD
jgi:hypothetical protein